MNQSRSVENIHLDLDDLIESFRDPLQGAQRLGGISLFNRFTQDELVEIYKLGRLRRLRKNAHVVVEGEPTRGMYLLLYGRVSVYKTDPTTGSLVRLAILEEGANFGEMSLFDRAPRSATVAAESQCCLFELDGEGFETFLGRAAQDQQIRFYRQCAEELAERFRSLNSDYITSQQMLWKHALRREDDAAAS